MNVSALLLMMVGNCQRKGRSQRGKECQSYFPQIFSISCPRSSPIFCSRSCRARKSERKSTEQGGEKKKENKRKQFDEEGRGGGEAKRRQSSALTSAPASLSVSGRKCRQRGHVFSLTAGACVTGVGNAATRPNAPMLPVGFWLVRDVVTVVHLGPRPLMWPNDFSCEAAEPTHWTSPSRLFNLWFVSLRKRRSVSCGRSTRSRQNQHYGGRGSSERCDTRKHAK